MIKLWTEQICGYFLLVLLGLAMFGKPVIAQENDPAISDRFPYCDLANTTLPSLEYIKADGRYVGLYYQAAAALNNEAAQHGEAVGAFAEEDLLAKIAEQVQSDCRVKAAAAINFSFDPTGMANAREEIIYYNWMRCKSGTHDTCNDTIELVVPPHYQACDYFYTVASRRGRHPKFSFKPFRWFEGDPEDPDRFQGYRVHLQSKGSDTLGGPGGNIQLDRVGLVVIPANLDNEARFQLGCRLEPRGAAESTPENDDEEPRGSLSMNCDRHSVCRYSNSTGNLELGENGGSVKVSVIPDNVYAIAVILTAEDGSETVFAAPDGRRFSNLIKQLTKGIYHVESRFTYRDFDPPTMSHNLTAFVHWQSD